MVSSRRRSYTGGIRAGIFNATYPFAELTVSKETLQIRIRIPWTRLLIGVSELSFRPCDIVAFRKRGRWWLWRWMFGGLQIFHNIKEYPTPIVFWGNPDKVEKIITSTGFVPEAPGEPDPYEWQSVRLGIIVGLSFLGIILVLSIVMIILGD